MNGNYEIQGISSELYKLFISDWFHSVQTNLLYFYFRPVQKRVVSIAFNKDGSQIVIADKFGDVYR